MSRANRIKTPIVSPTSEWMAIRDLEPFPDRPRRILGRRRPMKWALPALFVVSTPLLLSAQAPVPQAPPPKVVYDTDVKPLLAQNGYSCHGPDVQQSGLRLDRRQPALRGGD